MSLRHTAVLVATLIVIAAIPVDAARGPGRVHSAFRGRIVLLKKRPPSSFASDGAFAGFLRAHDVKHVWPRDKKEQAWNLEFFAFLKRSSNDVEVKVSFYDITETRKLIDSDAIYLSQRGEMILASNIVLQKPRFRINRKYAMYITTAQGNQLATTTFWLRGKPEVYSGRVTFSDEEARGK